MKNDRASALRMGCVCGYSGCPMSMLGPVVRKCRYQDGGCPVLLQRSGMTHEPPFPCQASQPRPHTNTVLLAM